MLESEIIYFIPMLFCVSIFLANFYLVFWFIFLPLYFCLLFLLYLGSTITVVTHILHAFSIFSSLQVLSAHLCHRHRKVGTNFKFWQNDYYSVVFVYFINIQSVFSYSNVTKDTENEWGLGKRQKSESGSGNEGVKELCLLNLSKKLLDC